MVIYRILATLFALAQVPAALRQKVLRDRLGLAAAKHHAPHIWLHGASVGELNSVLPLLKRLIRDCPEQHWVITCNSTTARDTALEWSLPRVAVVMAPFDLAFAVRCVKRRFNVSAHITLESEIWPHRILTGPEPKILLGGRMSAKTAKTWEKFPQLAARVFGAFEFVSAQDEGSDARLRALGCDPDCMGPVADLKAQYVAPDMRAEAELSSAFDRANTFLAASTHDGEDEIVLEAYKQAAASEPDLRLIIAPRHPDRGDQIADQATRHGLKSTRRSLGQAPSEQVFIADTLGEMPMWYSLAGRVFIGGTLTNRGGHTPYEPAHFECALIFGPDTQNFAAPFAILREHGLAQQVENSVQLAEAITRLNGAKIQSERGEEIKSLLSAQTDPDTLFDALLRALPAQ